MADWEDVASLHQIRDGGVYFGDAGDVDVMLFRQGDVILAWGANCTHAFASLRDARIEGTAIVCPRHGARFDLTSGRAISGNCPPLPKYQVRREGARVLVKM